MANLKEIRSRIASVKSTQQITSAMKMVSAAKLRKSQAAIVKLRPYSSKMSDIMAKLGSSMSDDVPFARKTNNKQENILIIALTSNKGLCSTFNSSVIKLAAKRIEDYQKQGHKINVMSYGKKGDAAFKKTENINYLGSNDEIWEALTFDNVNKEADKFMNDFLQKKYDRIEIIYNQFKNAATQITIAENFLPIRKEFTEIKKENSVKHNNDYIFAPSKEEIINSVIPQSLKTQFYKCFLDSFTSEHGARMTSMNKATDNAQSLLKELTLTYNKQRQSDITNQIIEVSNGANAV
ncbi:MAG: ATP synthase F1 subunit gamma [Bacteroidales bacterium]|nr:ATP synthase F1 subunit gamma [Bacteroidales bacterium]